MINIKLKPGEQILEELISAYNSMYTLQYPQILAMNHFELYQLSGRLHTVQDWKNFLMEPRLQNYFNDEQDLLVRNKISKLLSGIGDNNSTAQAQGLRDLMNQQKEKENSRNDETKFIYTFIPLSEQEEQNPNVNILQSIPDVIKEALYDIRQGTGNKNR